VAEDKAGMVVTLDMAVVVRAVKAVPVAVAAVKLAARAVRAGLVAASGNFSARRRSASFASRRWT
jgi:hypothetical protein